MPRPRKGNGEATGDTTPATTTTEPSGEPHISVRMEGGAEAVKRQLGVTSEAKPEEKKPEVIEDPEKFFALLKNPKLAIKVKRLRPKMWKGNKASFEVLTSELPLQWEEIKQEVESTAKGGVYKVSVIEPSTGSVIDARNFEIEGDPKLEETEMTPEEREMFNVGEAEKDASQITEEGLERTARVTARQIELERLQQSLRELRTPVNGGKQRASESDARVDELERRIVQAKHEADLENQQRRHDAEMKELRDLIKQQNQAKPAQQQSDVALLLQQMQKDREASDRRFELMQKQMHDDKQNQMLEELRAIKNKPQQQQGGMLEMAETMLKLRKVFGWGGDDDDDDDGDEKDDDRPWWERALDQLGKRLGPKVIDRIFDKLDGLEGSGKKVDRDAFLKTVEEEKSKEDELVRLATEEALKRLPAPKEPVTVPATVKNPEPKAAAPDVPTVSVMERKVVSGTPIPEPAPAPAPQAAATPAPAAPQPEPAADPNMVAKITCQKVAELAFAIEQELELRPRKYDWNYDFAWSELPEAILEKVCKAKNPAELFDAFKVEGLNPELLEKMKQKVISNQRSCDWLQKGINELNRWWAKSLKNPNFDPADEEEGEPAEDEGTGL